jgi:RsiW-degrading membrane proteinase PrsW (M82 family)
MGLDLAHEEDGRRIGRRAERYEAEDRMRSGIEHAETDNTQRRYARLAGFLFLVEIILALGSGFILSHIAGSGTFTETAKRIAASEHLYRAALSVVVIVTLSSVVLAFALYATLKPVNRLLAQLAMIFSLGDSFLAMVVRMCSFVRVHLYTSAQNVGGGATAQRHCRT